MDWIMEIIIFNWMSVSLPVLLGQMSTYVWFTKDLYLKLKVKSSPKSSEINKMLLWYSLCTDELLIFAWARECEIFPLDRQQSGQCWAAAVIISWSVSGWHPVTSTDIVWHPGAGLMSWSVKMSAQIGSHWPSHINSTLSPVYNSHLLI